MSDDRLKSNSNLTIKGKIIFMLVSVFLFFISIEMILNLWGFFPKEVRDYVTAYTPWIQELLREDEYESDPVLLWKFKPNQKGMTKSYHPGKRVKLTINSKGIRGREISYQKDEDTFRIACFGDSSTFGASVGNDETYSYLLEEMLNKTGPEHISFGVINAGVNDYSTFQVYKYLATEIIKYKPDLITLYSAHNDIEMYEKEDKEQSVDCYWILIIHNLLDKSKAFRFYKEKIVLPLKFKVKAMFKESKVQDQSKDRLKPRVTLEDHFAYLGKIIKICRREDIKVLYLTYLERGEGRVTYNPYATEVIDRREGLDPTGSTLKIVDILPVFNQNISEDVTDVLYDHCHPNETGHRLIAEEIYKVIMNDGEIVKKVLRKRYSSEDN